jgi:hypothetical protein
LECGIFAHDFARARCGACGHDYLVAFSTKAGEYAPRAAQLSDHVFPRLPMRQSVPKPLRCFMQRDRAVLDILPRIFLRGIVESLQARSPGVVHARKAALHMGALAFIPRFGSSLNKHLDFHMCVIDGGF